MVKERLALFVVVSSKLPKDTKDLGSYFPEFITSPFEFTVTLLLKPTTILYLSPMTIPEGKESTYSAPS